MLTVSSTNNKSDGEKIGECMKTYKKLRIKSSAYKDFLEELKQITEDEELSI